MADDLLKSGQSYMKALMIFGAIVGFLIGTGFGLAASSPWPAALWRSCAAALVAAILARWWGRVWLRSLRDSLQERLAQRAPSTAEAKPAANL